MLPKDRMFVINRRGEMVYNAKCKAARPPKGKQIIKVWTEGKGLTVQSSAISIGGEELFDSKIRAY